MADKIGSVLDVALSSFEKNLIGMLSNTKQDGARVNTKSREDLAKEAQHEIEFDADDVYNTLVDPHLKEKKHLEEFVNAANERYKSGSLLDVPTAFEEDFYYWSLTHFRLVKRESLQSLRDILIANNVKLNKGRGVAISKALSDYIETIWSSSEHQVKLDPQHNQDRNFQGNISKDEGESKNSSDSGIQISTNRASPRPSEVSKLFSRDEKYSGNSTEPLRRRFKTFCNAAKLCNVDPANVATMFPLMETTFLKGQALKHYQDVIRDKAGNVNEVIDLLEKHFLGHRARRVNDEIWDELTYQMVKNELMSDQKSTAHANVLGVLLDKIANLADIRTGPSSDTIVIAKTISAVRNVDIYSIVCQNPPIELQELNATLRSCALEADRAIIRNGSSRDTKLVYKNEIDKMMDEKAAFYVDRQIQSWKKNWRGRSPSQGSRRDVPGYGRARSRSPSRTRFPTKMCVICTKLNCNDPRCKAKTQKLFHNLSLAYNSAPVQDNNVDPVEDPNGTCPDTKHDEDDGYDSTFSFISMSKTYVAMGVYPQNPWLRVDSIMIDTGCSELSTIGERLVTAAQVASAMPTKPDWNSTINIRGIGGARVKTKGTMNFSFIFGGRMYTIILHIVQGDDMMILSHLDLDRLQLCYVSYPKVVYRPSDFYCEKVSMRGKLPFLVFESFGFFSSTKLRAIHRNLGHPSVDKQMKVIEAAEIPDLDPNTREKLQKIVKHCKACQLQKAKPRRFLFSLKDGVTGEFNHSLQLDVCKLEDGYVLHVICSGTGFQQGKFIGSMSAAEAWNTLRRCWINVYAGAPDVLVSDAGTNFASKEFGDAADSMGIVLKIVPTEAHERIGKVERSHAVLRTVYTKLKHDLPKISKDDRLSLAFRALNDTPNGETGVSPTAMVFGVHPKLPGGGNRGSYAQRAKIVSDCTKLVVKMRARRIVRDAGKRQNSVNGIDIETIRRAAPGSKVQVYREKIGWKEYILAKVEGNNVNVILPSGLISSFSIHNVKPVIENETNLVSDAIPKQLVPQGVPEQGLKSILRKSTEVPQNGIASRTRSKVNFSTPCFVSTARMKTSGSEFRESRLTEIKDLQDQGCFEVVDESEATGKRVYNHAWVDKVKENGKKKSRMCVAAFNDKDHGLFTAAPTVKRMSIRTMVSICAAYKYKLHGRDVKQAFPKSKTQLRRPVFMRAPPEMGVLPGQLIKVVKALYGMPESPMHWFKTYGDYHRDDLNMKPAAIDQCLWYCMKDQYLDGILALQVDDTLFAGSPSFLKLEMEKAKKFPNSGRTIATSDPIRFNGLDLRITSDGIRIDQAYYINGIKAEVKDSNMEFTKFRSVRQKLAYAAYSSMPDILVFMARLAQYTQAMYEKDKPEVSRLLRKAVKVLLRGPSMNGIRYVTILPENMEVVVCVDAAFATNPDKSSQLGILVLVRDTKSKAANVLHYASSKSKRVAKSVLAAELFAMIDGFDAGFSIRKTLENITGQENMALSLFTDSKSLYGLVVTLAQTTEKRLQIDLEMLREGYEKREITNVIWISGSENPSDDLTKPDKRNGTLASLLGTNKFDPVAISWIERDIAPVSTATSYHYA